MGRNPSVNAPHCLGMSYYVNFWLRIEKNVSNLFQSVANSQTDDTEQEITSLKTRVSFLFSYLLLLPNVGISKLGN